MLLTGGDEDRETISKMKTMKPILPKSQLKTKGVEDVGEEKGPFLLEQGYIFCFIGPKRIPERLPQSVSSASIFRLDDHDSPLPTIKWQRVRAGLARCQNPIQHPSVPSKLSSSYMDPLVRTYRIIVSIGWNDKVIDEKKVDDVRILLFTANKKGTE
jgi:hypothetical protein